MSSLNPMTLHLILLPDADGTCEAKHMKIRIIFAQASMVCHNQETHFSSLLWLALLDLENSLDVE